MKINELAKEHHTILQKIKIVEAHVWELKEEFR